MPLKIVLFYQETQNVKTEGVIFVNLRLTVEIWKRARAPLY